MTRFKSLRRPATALAAIALVAGPVATLGASPAIAQSARPSQTLNISSGTGTLVRLPAPMAEMFIANEGIADVQVRSPSQLYVFGKAPGETTLYATDNGGRIVYSATIRVGTNTGSVDEMLRLAMPEADIRATPMNNLMLLTGTVTSPEDVAQAEELVQAYVGGGVKVVSRLRSSVPLQVNLKVKIAEVNRAVLKRIGVNLLSSDTTSGFQFGIGSGGGIAPGATPADPAKIVRTTLGTTLSGGGKLLGLDLLGSLELAETDGLVATLAEPNLTALSGETASFLAGGEFPIPVSQALGSLSIEYKQYGVGLAFTPVVLGDGRISMRVRPEVSELSNEGSIRLNGFEVPAITTRRAETTVELGSGQSFMIAGLLRNATTNSIEKAPFLGDLPILGALFRSTSFRRSETELVIIVTPYLVRPVSGQLALPVDGFSVPTDVQRVFLGQSYTGRSGPAPAAAPVAAAPAVAAPAAAPGFKM